MKAGLAEYEQMTAIKSVAAEFGQQTERIANLEAKLAEVSGDIEVLSDQISQLTKKIDQLLSQHSKRTT